MKFYDYFFNSKLFTENIATQNEKRKADGKRPYRLVKKEVCKEGTKYLFSQARKKYDVYCPRETNRPENGAMFSFNGDTSPEFFKSEEYKEIYSFISNAYCAACSKKYTV